MKFVFFFIAAAAFASSAYISENKAEAHCPIRGCGACSTQCPEATLITGAKLLVNELCNIIAGNILNQLQTVVTPQSKLQYFLQQQNGCSDSGVLNYLAGVIPLMPELDCFNLPTIDSAVFDGKNRVTVITENTLRLGTDFINTYTEHIFEAVGNTCELHLISSKVTEYSCLPAKL